MKVNSNNNTTFRSIYNNKALKKGLEFAAENGTLFGAATILGFSAVARPLAIYATPNTDKQNKNIACAKSFASSGAGFLMSLAVSNPFAKAIKKIDNEPSTYLKPDTVKFLSDGCEKITHSKRYKFATQMFKLGLGLAIAAPKAMFTSAATPYIMNKFFPPNKNSNETLNFRGKGGNENLTRNIGKAIDNKNFQKFSEKYKDSNFPMHIISLTDALTTGVFVNQIQKNDKIDKSEKQMLTVNSLISTGLSILSGYILDKLSDKPTEKFIQKFREINKTDKNLEKQTEGIKIAKPILLLGSVYYILIPLVSTFFADKAVNKKCKHS